eukprot:scaffold36.g5072.t1
MASEDDLAPAWKLSYILSEDQHERLAKLRRGLKLAFAVQCAYLPLRTLWHSVPALLGEPLLTQTGFWILCAGAGALALRRFASGHGRPGAERDVLWMAYSIAAYLLMAECGLVLYSYHVMWPKEQLYPELLARRSTWRPGLVRSAAQAFEVALDLVGIAAFGLGAYLSKELVLDKRYMRRAAEAAAAEGRCGESNGRLSKMDQRKLQADIKQLTKKAGSLLTQMNQQLLRLRDKNQQLVTESAVIYVQLAQDAPPGAAAAAAPLALPPSTPSQQGQMEQQQQQQQEKQQEEKQQGASSGAPAATGEMGASQQAAAAAASSSAAFAAPPDGGTGDRGGSEGAGPSGSGVDAAGFSANTCSNSKALAVAGADRQGVMEVPRDVALMCPFIQREILASGSGLPGTLPVRLPKQVTENSWAMVLDYCRFHSVQGRSDKVDTNQLCELTSAADALDMRPLVDLASRAIAKMIEARGWGCAREPNPGWGKTPEQIREAFRLPDDLTEEEKLEPLRTMTDDPRIRMLNRLYAKKRKELAQRKRAAAAKVNDDRPIDELLSFIEAEADKSKAAAGGAKPRAKKKKVKAKGPRADEQQAAAGAGSGSEVALASDAAAAGGCASKPSTEPGSGGSGLSSQDTSPVRGSRGSSAAPSGHAVARPAADAAAAAASLGALLPAGGSLLEWEESEGEDEDGCPDSICLASRASLLHRQVTQLTSLTAFRARLAASAAQQQRQAAGAEQAAGGKPAPGAAGAGAALGGRSPASAVDAAAKANGRASPLTESDSEGEEVVDSAAARGLASSPSSSAGSASSASSSSGTSGPAPATAVAAAGASSAAAALGAADVGVIVDAIASFLESLGLQDQLVLTRGAARQGAAARVGAASPPGSQATARELPSGARVVLRWTPPPA